MKKGIIKLMSKKTVDEILELMQKNPKIYLKVSGQSLEYEFKYGFLHHPLKKNLNSFYHFLSDECIL